MSKAVADVNLGKQYAISNLMEADNAILLSETPMNY